MFPMKIVEADVTHGMWMLDHQINNPYDLYKFWLLSGPMAMRGVPAPEFTGDWTRGLEEILRGY